MLSSPFCTSSTVPAPSLRPSTVWRLAAGICITLLAMLAPGSAAWAACNNQSDLIVSVAQINRTAEGTYSYSVRLRNIDDCDSVSNNFNTTVDLSPTSTVEATILYDVSQEGLLLPGAQSNEFTGTINSAPDSHCDFTVIADSGGAVSEEDDNNNSLGGTVGNRLPNLVEDPTGSDPSVTRMADGEYEHEFTVCNVDECADASSTYTTDLIMDVDTVSVVSTTNPLSPGACETFGPTTATGLSDANCSWTLNIDSLNDVSEGSSESSAEELDNDDATGTVVRDPDIVPAFLDCSFDVAECSGGYLFAMEVANLDECADATLTGSKFETMLFQCTDDVVRKTAQLFSDSGVTNVEAGNSKSFSYCYSVADVCKCCRAWLDSNEYVDENDDTNNTRNDNYALVSTGSPATLTAAISNMTSTEVSVTHEIIMPEGWIVTFDGGPSPPATIPGDGESKFLVSITPSVGGPGMGRVEIISTESPTGFTQNNVIDVLIGLPAASKHLVGLTAALLLGTGAWIAARRRRRGHRNGPVG